MNLLEIQSVSRTYGSRETAVHALENASFSVLKGNLLQLWVNPAPPRVCFSIGKETLRTHEQTILVITQNRSIVQAADRILQVHDSVITDLGRCTK